MFPKQQHGSCGCMLSSVRDSAYHSIAHVCRAAGIFTPRMLPVACRMISRAVPGAWMPEKAVEMVVVEMLTATFSNTCRITAFPHFRSMAWQKCGYHWNASGRERTRCLPSTKASSTG